MTTMPNLTEHYFTSAIRTAFYHNQTSKSVMANQDCSYYSQIWKSPIIAWHPYGLEKKKIHGKTRTQLSIMLILQLSTSNWTLHFQVSVSNQGYKLQFCTSIPCAVFT